MNISCGGLFHLSIRILPILSSLENHCSSKVVLKKETKKVPVCKLILGASICSQVDDWFSVKRLVFHHFDVFPSNDWISSQCRLGQLEIKSFDGKVSK